MTYTLITLMLLQQRDIDAAAAELLRRFRYCCQMLILLLLATPIAITRAMLRRRRFAPLIDYVSLPTLILRYAITPCFQMPPYCHFAIADADAAIVDILPCHAAIHY